MKDSIYIGLDISVCLWIQDDDIRRVDKQRTQEYQSTLSNHPNKQMWGREWEEREKHRKL